ncbi:MAG: hypothetical protein JZD40_02320, partial [Sulfolobus sp.]|nr:hypothetical protein [Sulfolobus sp.]
MAIDIVERLKNDPEFIKKVAEAVLSNVLASKLTNIENTISQIVEKFAENDRKFNMLLEEIRNLREEQT